MYTENKERKTYLKSFGSVGAEDSLVAELVQKKLSDLQQDGRKHALRHVRNQKHPLFGKLRDAKIKDFFEKRGLDHLVREKPSKKLVSWEFGCHETKDASGIGVRSWCHLCGADFTSLHNARVTRPGKLPVIF